MSEQTNIGWTDHTGGPWLGCTEVSPGCANCYSRELTNKKFGHCSADHKSIGIMRQAYRAAGFADWATRPVWGKTAPRVVTKGFWPDAARWNAAGEICVQCAHPVKGTDCPCGQMGAIGQSRRANVFPSLIDWLDEMPAGILNQAGQWQNIAEVRARFLDLIRRTPNLNWLLLTKRPQNFPHVLESIREWLFESPEQPHHKALWDWVTDWLTGRPPSHVWVGASTENQKMADARIPELLKIPAAIRFLSVEPLLEEIKLEFRSQNPESRIQNSDSLILTPAIRWVIVGGESGANRRDCGVEAICNVARQCVAAGVPVYVKQASAFKSEMQGLIPDEIWQLKQFPQIKRQKAETLTC